MDFPFGHGHHHHQSRDDEDADDRRRQPPAGFYPPPGVHHVSHESRYEPHPPNSGGSVHQVSHDRGYDPYPPFSSGAVHQVSHDRGYDPSPQFSSDTVHHVSHDRGYDPYPPFSTGTVHHVSHDRGYDPPPPFSGGSVHHVSHEPELGYARPPPFSSAAVVPPPHAPFAGSPVQHVSHDTPYGHRPDYAEHVSHERRELGSMNRQPTVRIFTKAEENYSLSIRDGKVILARKDPSDERQHWIKDLKYSTKVKDEEGFPAFALVNKATGEAVKHAFGATKPVGLIPYDPNYPDESVLWSESKDLGDGFRCIRMVNNIRLNFDAFHGDEDHGGVHDGTILVLWEWFKGKNQRWKIVPY